MSENANRVRLRPEARPFGWGLLNKSQREAYTVIVGALAEAVQALPDHKPDSGTSQEPVIEEERTSRILLLSGERGTGKTSLLLGLMKDTEGRSDRKKTQSCRTQAATETPAKAKPEDLREPFEKIQDHLVWLEPLDMEPLPSPVNLLVSILVRIEKAVGGSEPSANMPVGLLNPQPGGESALMELRRLIGDVAITWEGNLDKRAAQLDPDAYSAEVCRCERARLSLNSRLASALEQLARQMPRTGVWTF